MSSKKRIVIIGATSTIAEHCARLWVHYPLIELILVGRNKNRLERVASDLRVRNSQSNISVVPAEFLEPIAIQNTVDGIIAQGKADIVLIAHGLLPNQAECQNNLQICREVIEINAISPVLYMEAFAKHMAQANQGTIALIGSVAGDRGRKSNYIYGSAKSLLERYAQGLQHRFAKTGIKIILIKPGPTNTRMTEHLKRQGARLASVEYVAKQIIKAIELRKSVVYIPRKWKIIMLFMMHIPNIIFNKINV